MDDIDIPEFWSRLKAINAGFLGTSGGTAGAGARPVPMSHQLRDGDSTIWFITAHSTDLAQAAKAGDSEAQYVVAEGGKGLYAVLHGTLTHHADREVLEDLWSPVVDAWFQGGKDDPEVCLLALRVDSAEVWLTPTSGLSFVFGVVRAQITGSDPDMGTYGTLSGADLAQGRAA